MATTILEILPKTGSHAKTWGMVAILATCIVWSVVSISLPRTVPAAATQEGGKDLQAYRQIVERVHRGEGYYDAAGAELRAGGYATSSVFNWRLPTYAWLLSATPRPEWAQALLILLAVTALFLAYTAERKQGGVGRAVLLMVLMAGAFQWCIDGDAYFSQELWSGTLIALSIGAFAVQQRSLGVIAGLAALFMRELAAPYVLIALALSIQEKRWREVAAWTGGVAAFAVFFGWHAWQVSQHCTGAERVEAEGWLQCGGPAFVICTCQMNVWLFQLPAWIAGIYLAASLVGMANWRGPTAFRVGATAGGYLVAFLFFGKSVNNYWGLLYAALLPWGIVRLTGAFQKMMASVEPYGRRGRA